jgi:hypothetical protein
MAASIALGYGGKRSRQDPPTEWIKHQDESRLRQGATLRGRIGRRLAKEEGRLTLRQMPTHRIRIRYIMEYLYHSSFSGLWLNP